jgi:hypothetical protein
MDRTQEQVTRGKSHWDPKYPFDLVVAYEDIATRNQALHLYDRIAQRLLDDYDFQCSWWKMDFLKSRPLFEQAADAAAESNMLVLSLRDGHRLPEVIERWLEAITQRRDYRKTALVSLICNLTPDKIHGAPVVTSLHRFAHQANMDFFCNTFDLPRESTDTSFERIDARVHTVTPLLNEILHRQAPFPRGINE